jgi:hypothetical protein
MGCGGGRMMIFLPLPPAVISRKRAEKGSLPLLQKKKKLLVPFRIKMRRRDDIEINELEKEGKKKGNAEAAMAAAIQCAAAAALEISAAATDKM